MQGLTERRMHAYLLQPCIIRVLMDRWLLRKCACAGTHRKKDACVSIAAMHNSALHSCA